MSISIKELSKSYGKQIALNNISLEIKKGEIVGFLGPNGAGKSTLMKILTTFLPFEKGCVLINGVEVSKKPKEVKKYIGYLAEHNPLYLDLYVNEYLEFQAGIHKIDKNRINEVINITGLLPESHKKIEQLSKGYRQRVGLAAALLHNPEVLILDEPTTGLDPNQLVDMRELIKEIGKDKTILLSTHIMQEVEAICNRAIVIKNGEKIADLPLNSLKDDEANQTIEIEFDYKLEIEFLKRKNLPNLVDIKGTTSNHWIVIFDKSEDMRSYLFDFAQEMGVKILSMQRRSKKLEDFFIEKTK